MEPFVQILLSTYNGSRFLREQMESLLQQDWPNLQVLVRDDGSTDQTAAILQNYTCYPQVKVQGGSNVGVVNSFFTLLQWSDPRADYVAFCDQDDVWKPNKISRAVSLLQGRRGPALYGGTTTIVDEQLNPLGSTPCFRGPFSLGNALIQNIAPGCTMVLNRQARDYILRGLPRGILVHDWWVYLVVSAFGEVVFDPMPTTLYRQHGGNTIGARSNRLGHWWHRLRRFIRRREGLFAADIQASELLRVYGDLLTNEQRLLVTRFLNRHHSLGDRLNLVVGNRVFRQDTLDTLVVKMLILFGLTGKQ